MKTLIRVITVLMALPAAVAALVSCSTGNGGANLPVPDERIELFTNQNNSGKDDDYERKWRHNGSFKTVTKSASAVDVILKGDELNIKLPVAESVEVYLYDGSGKLVASDSYSVIESSCTVSSKVPGVGSYHLEIIVDGDSYTGEFLK
ncbi:MAG: hypothetical protein II613_01805 [Bacteroidales bacterium]|nr:hypothetical protein [Bacteroidales bacterium]